MHLAPDKLRIVAERGMITLENAVAAGRLIARSGRSCVKARRCTRRRPIILLQSQSVVELIQARPSPAGRAFLPSAADGSTGNDEAILRVRRWKQLDEIVQISPS
jgi:hypothetical protein